MIFGSPCSVVIRSYLLNTFQGNFVKCAESSYPGAGVYDQGGGFSNLPRWPVKCTVRPERGLAGFRDQPQPPGVARPGLPAWALTHSQAEGVEGVPVDAVQLAHQGDAELHHDADVRVLPLQVLWDVCTGAVGSLALASCPDREVATYTPLTARLPWAEL